MKKVATVEVQAWLEVRREAGRRIDPETAEVACEYGEALDPYGIHLDLLEEGQCIRKNFFVRAPGSDIWVWEGDLPEGAAEAVHNSWKRRSPS